MPYEYHFFHDHKLIHERAVDTVTDGDFINSFIAPTTDEKIDLRYNVISDYRRCRNEISVDAVKRASEIYRAHYPKIEVGKWAVIPTDHRRRLRVQFFSFFAESSGICCCESIREALVWLDLPEDLID